MLILEMRTVAVSYTAVSCTGAPDAALRAS